MFTSVSEAFGLICYIGLWFCVLESTAIFVGYKIEKYI